MADIFLSYALADNALATPLAEELTRCGWTVWWDRQIVPGAFFDDPIRKELESAKCIVVLWSQKSVTSRWVSAEAKHGRTLKKLISVVIEEVQPPWEFADLQYLDLSGWRGESSDSRFLLLKQQVENHLLPPSDRSTSREIYPGAAGVLDSRNSTPDLTPVAPWSPSPSPILFLCYRREDTEDAAGRLHERLVQAYGANAVFMDIDSVPLGVDFVEHVNVQIGRCAAAIVMIGRNWLTVEDKHHRRRLDNEDDLVRAEIAAALKQRIPVIPVLVQNAEMPQADQLPEDIRLLSRRNGIKLGAAEWRSSVDRLLKELDGVMGRKKDG